MRQLYPSCWQFPTYQGTGRAAAVSECPRALPDKETVDPGGGCPTSAGSHVGWASVASSAGSRGNVRPPRPGLLPGSADRRHVRPRTTQGNASPSARRARHAGWGQQRRKAETPPHAASRSSHLLLVESHQEVCPPDRLLLRGGHADQDGIHDRVKAERQQRTAEAGAYLLLPNLARPAGQPAVLARPPARPQAQRSTALIPRLHLHPPTRPGLATAGLPTDWRLSARRAHGRCSSKFVTGPLLRYLSPSHFG